MCATKTMTFMSPILIASPLRGRPRRQGFLQPLCPHFSPLDGNGYVASFGFYLQFVDLQDGKGYVNTFDVDSFLGTRKMARAMCPVCPAMHP